jgi:hypothetical protein
MARVLRPPFIMNQGTGKIDASTSPDGMKQGTIPGQVVAPSCRVIIS